MTCTHCLLDDSVSDITFDATGQCHYCKNYLVRKRTILQDPQALAALKKELQQPQQRYDCIVGVSGGLDSSYLLVQAVKHGWKPLAVHVDTGWNTELSVRNIEQLTKNLQVDLMTYVLDWEQFKQLQIAYLRAGVIDLEFPTDHYYLSALYKVAADKGITTLFTGNNYVSEGIMPDCWIHNKGDTMNMLDIFKQHGNGSSLSHLPTLTLWRKFYYYNVLRIRNVFLLNYLNYDREQAKHELTQHHHWQAYPVKHGESVFTRFYHRYMLPKRFKVDYRKAHLSSLICNQQLTREQGLQALTLPIADEQWLEEDKNYVLKKLGLSLDEFNQLMVQPIMPHAHFRSEMKIKRLYNTMRHSWPLNRLLQISNRH